MQLTHPDNTSTDTHSYTHPFTSNTVQSAFQTVNPDIPHFTLHKHLETTQQALEHKLTHTRNLYDPMNLVGEHVHKLEENPTPPASPYPSRLYIEDGYYYLNSDTAKRQIIAGKQTRQSLQDEINFDNPSKDEHERIQETQHELAADVNLDEHTNQEIIEHAGTKYGIWDGIADLLSIPENSPTLHTIKLVHERCYNNAVQEESEHGITGFVIGVPEMFMAGLRAEQRLFSALVETEISPAKIVDMYGTRISYNDATKWGAKRGVSESAVIQNRSAAEQTLKNTYEPGTYPENLINTF